MPGPCDCEDLETALKYALELIGFLQKQLEDERILPSPGAHFCEWKLEGFLEKKGWYF